MASPKAAIKAAENAPRGEVKRYATGHFEIYVGEWFERAVADQTEFLTRNLVDGDLHRGSRQVALDPTAS